MLHILCWLGTTYLRIYFMQYWWYSFMVCIQRELHSVRVYPEDPLDRQPMPKKQVIALASQEDCKKRVFVLRKGKLFSILKQAHGSYWKWLRHSVAGGSMSLFATRQSILCFSNESAFFLAVQSSSQMADSAMIVKSVSGPKRAAILSPQRVIVSPPTDDPERTTLLAQQSPKCQCKYFKWDHVLSAPVKYRFVSLYLTGSLEQP